LLQSDAEIFEHCAIGVESASISRKYTVVVRRQIQNLPKLCFLFADSLFRSPVGRDVSHRAHEFGAAPLICRRATDDLDVLNRSIRHQQSMFESELRPITRSTLNDLLDRLSVVRMGSLHNQLGRNLGFRVKLKYAKGFIRPVDLFA
jgi:hypothetical protein